MAFGWLKKIFLSAWEVIEVVAIATVTVFIIRTFLVQPFLVSGASMEPNFSDGNYLLIDEITYRLRAPERGEVIVFRYPKDRSIFFIKRIIGLPGEEVVIENGRIKVIKDKKEIMLDEPYLSRDAQAGDGSPTDRILGEGEYFIMGDNRLHSYDSRNWGPVNEKDMVGLVRLRIFPFTEFKLFETPQYEIKNG